MGFWDVDAKEYHRIPVDEQVEVIVTEASARLRRRRNETTGLPLIDLTG
ncbi:hypothetical protein L1787_18050 [Acuticoccus sp. M5D2P5]|nr:hypothetical protein [Acuticoccus kalidii]MCF3935302.1 hypothetical protein [Acuticoccus kalidii]